MKKALDFYSRSFSAAHAQIPHTHGKFDSYFYDAWTVHMNVFYGQILQRRSQTVFSEEISGLYGRGFLSWTRYTKCTHVGKVNHS